MDQGKTLISIKGNALIPLDIEFECQDGEIFVVVGPSGSGKTTMLRCIAGLYKPDAGRIICKGNTWFDSGNKINVSVQHRAAGFVFQDYALFPHLTVRENITLPIKEPDKTIREERVNEYVQMVHLDGLEDRLPHQLSGGQQQRVAVARALARKPDILLLDEPFSSVDQQTRRFLVRELIQLKHKLNIPIIHVTHDLNEARRIADKLCIIQSGTGLQIDSPDNVMTRPVSSLVASLTGHDNIFTGNIIDHDKDSKITLIQWNSHRITATYTPNFEIDEKIDWIIPAYKIIPNMDIDSDGNLQNLFTGKICELLQLGEGTIISIAITNTDDYLQMNYSTHHVNQHGLKEGDTISVSLIPDGIHIMKRN
jgi:molybdate transport system ATP-binding protein